MPRIDTACCVAGLMLAALPAQAQYNQPPRIEFQRPSLEGSLPSPGPALPDPTRRRECRTIKEIVPEPMDDASIRSKALTLIHERGFNPYEDSTFREQVRAELKKTGGAFDIQRLEVTGVATNADAEPPFSGHFDPHLHPSYHKETEYENLDRGWLLRHTYGYWRSLKASGRDIRDAHTEMNGTLTPRGRDTLDGLQGKRINEIVAHSWGTDIVCNGILEGVIDPPPRRVVVVGVPNGYVTKWTELARRLNIEVKLYSSPADKVRVANSNELVWRYRGMNGLDDVPVYSRDHWRTKVEAYCARRREQCRTPGKEPTRIKVDKDVSLENAGLMQHSRASYYRYINERGELSRSVVELKEAEDARVGRAKEDILVKTFEEARAILQNNPFREDSRVICEDTDLTAPIHAAPAAAAESVEQYKRRMGDSLSQLAIAACRSDWGAAAAKLSAYQELGAGALPEVERRLDELVQSDTCASALLLRIIRMWGNGETLDLARLQAETRAVQAPPPDVSVEEPRERSNGSNCVQRGLWYKDCY